ncbi:MAG: hypothetical protein RL484_208 [Actinomycetota bacterium]
MKNLKKATALTITALLVGISSFAQINSAQAEQIDVSYLQTCLKTENASLDVLVLMDSSKSLRDGKPGEPREVPQGSDPGRKRGPILKSSLNILQKLAKESNADFNISLRNFGKNSDPDELEKLKKNWTPWTNGASGNSIDELVEKSLFDDSPGTQWASGLASAKSQFKQRIGEAQVEGGKSCPIMFWITDGAPTDSTSPICQDNTDSSLNWFRENNVLVLGGLLMPLDENERRTARDFKPLVEGETCGRNEAGWTRGAVIEANDVSDLAWRFVGLIAAIKNLVNLNGDNSTFNVDPSTSHIEIFTRRVTGGWQVKMPDGSEFCSSSNLTSRCRVQGDPVTGITTITVYPERPIQAAGAWSITPSLSSDDFLAYGGLDTPDKFPSDRAPRLSITPNSNPVSADEGEDSTFKVKLVNPDGSDFNLEGFKSIDICATIASSPSPVCQSGKTSVSLTVQPNSSDKSVDFEAVLVSARDSSREYRITDSVKIDVLLSGVFPRLVCEKEKDGQCLLSNLANKNSKAVSKFKVQAAEPGVSGGQLYLKDFVVLADEATERGDGHFFFQVTRSNGQLVNLNDPAQPLSPGENLTVTVSTDKAGEGKIQGIIKYKVVADGQEVERQLAFNFEVKKVINVPLLILMMLLAYLITVGLPYLYLLYSARKNAHFIVPDNEFAYLEVPVTITEGGKVISKQVSTESTSTNTFPSPAHQDLRFEAIDESASKIDLGQVHFEVLPPKWNPFKDSATMVSVPNSHVLSTYGGAGFLPGECIFSKSLIGEAVLYFASEDGLAPVMQTQTESNEPEVRGSLFASTSNAEGVEELTKKSGEILATALFIVPRYGNRKKSLEELTMKFKNTCESTNLGEHISELRTKELDAATAKIAAATAIVEGAVDRKQKSEDKEKSKKKRVSKDEEIKEEPAVTEKERSIFNSDSDKGGFDLFGDGKSEGSKGLFGDDGNPDSESGKSLW